MTPTGPETTPPATACFGCGQAAAMPYPVVLQKVSRTGVATQVREFRTIHVPLCAECGAKESNAGRRQAGCALLVWLVPAIALWIWTGEIRGLLFGLGAGFFLALIVKAFVKEHPISEKHPEVKAALRYWSFP